MLLNNTLHIGQFYIQIYLFDYVCIFSTIFTVFLTTWKFHSSKKLVAEKLLKTVFFYVIQRTEKEKKRFIVWETLAMAEIIFSQVFLFLIYYSIMQFCCSKNYF